MKYVYGQKMKSVKRRVISGFTALVIAASNSVVALPVILSQRAFAATNIVVNPTSMNGWSEYTTTGGTVQFVNEAGAPTGSGVLRLDTTSSNDSRASLNLPQSVALSSLTTLSYATKQVASSIPEIDAAFRVMVDEDGSLATTADQGTFVFEPYWQDGDGDFGPIVTNTWQTWDVAGGIFWPSIPGGKSLTGFTNTPGGPPSYTLAQIKSALPNAVVTGVSTGIGSYNPSSTILVDNFTVNDTVYDFEPAPYVPTAPPTIPAQSGTVIYDTLPGTLPSNSPSYGYQATQTREFGDKVTFAGTSRDLVSAAVTMSSWACESGAWNTGCTTTPGAKFTHPVTLNLYNVNGDGTAGSQIGSVTQTFEIPYRPSSDPTCATPTTWRDTNGNCFNGLNHVVVFDLSGITVPDTVVYGVSYNTMTYGSAPLGVTGPYDSLNVSLTTASPSVGTDTVAGSNFRNRTPAGFVEGVDGNGAPLVRFTAQAPNTAPVVNFVSPTPAEGSVVSGTITPHVLATDDYGMGSYYIRLWKGAFESGIDNLEVNNCSSAPGAFLLGTSQDITCPAIDTTILEDGTYVLSAQFQDGHIVWGQALRTFTVDNTAPEAPATLGWVAPVVPCGGSTSSFTITATWSAVSGVDHYEYWVTTPMRNASNAWTTTVGTNSYNGAFTEGEGLYTYKVRAVDAVGNASAWSNTCDATYDTVAPALPEHLSPANNSVQNFNNFYFDWTDSAGATSYEVQFSQSDSTDGNGALNSGVWSGDSSHNQPTESRAWSSGANGTWYWQVRAVDLAGNKSAWTTPWKMTIDMSAPSVPNHVSPANGSVRTSAAQDKMDWTDINDPSGITYYYQSSTSSATNPDGSFVSPAYSSGALTSSEIPTPGTPEGTYYWHVRTQDGAGNSSAWSSAWTITIDNTAPALNINAIATATDTTPTITGTVNDPSAVVKVSIDGGAFVNATNNGNGTWTYTPSSPLSVGNHTVKATATDVAGNTATDGPDNFTIAAVLGDNTNNHIQNALKLIKKIVKIIIISIGWLFNL